MYVALGDSMSIDEYAGGPGRGAASLFYRNHPDWPEFRGRDLVTLMPGLGFHLLAFDGATSEGVLAVQVPRLRHLPRRPRIVTITVGGNDLLSYFGIEARDGERAAEHLRRRLRRILEACCALVGPQGCVLVGNIYDPTDGTGGIPGSEFPRWGASMHLLELFNRTIAEVTQEFPVELVDIHSHFLGHGVRAQDETFIHYHPEDPTVWYTQLIEPNARGAHEIRRCFYEAFLRTPLARSLGEAAGGERGRASEDGRPPTTE